MRSTGRLWPRFGRLLLGAGLVATLLEGCGGAGDGGGVPPPSITAQPQATTVGDGQPAAFSVSASGEGLRYQWQRNAADLPGASAATLALPATALADSGAGYRVVVSNAGGSVTSSTATLTVTPVAPAFTGQPAAASVTDGAAATFSAGASGSLPLAYQWQRNGVDIAGATAASYTLNPTTLADSGATFAVRVSNAAGSVNSSAAGLLVNPAPVGLVAAPQPATAAEGATASFGVVASGSAPLAYQWQRNGVDIAGADAAGYTTPALTLADDGARYSVRVSNAAGAVTSAAAVLTVAAVPVAPGITTPPASLWAGLGQAATFSVAATGSAPLNYQWFRDGVLLAGANGSSLTIGSLAAGDSGASFAVTVSNTAGSVSSPAAVLRVRVAGPAPQRLAAGSKSSLGLRADGTVLVWGSALEGLLTTGPAWPGSSARQVPDLADGISFAASPMLADRTGRARAWGRIGAGLGGDFPRQLPPPTRVLDTPTPLSLPADMVQATQGSGGSVALRADGSVWYLPGVIEVLADRVVVSARQAGGLPPIAQLGTVVGGGFNYTPLIDVDGGVWALVVSTTGGGTSFLSNVSRISGLPPMAQVVCNTACIARSTSGTVWTWSAFPSATTPVQVAGLNDVVSVAGTADTRLAVDRAGQVWSWGGRLTGRDEAVAPTTPTRVPGLTNAVEVAAAGHVLVRMADGSVWGWGLNDADQLGTGTAGSASFPVITPLRAVGIDLD